MRTRFAPSPTGFLHIGGLRTTLYAYLVAKQTGGEFLLRIEDTDRERFVEGAVEQILDAMHWAGIPADEGVVLEAGAVTQRGSKGPYIQSERLEIYKKYADELLEKGHAYRCFCTPERLDLMRKQQQQNHQAPMYDRLCLHLEKEEVEQRVAAGERHVIRMKIPHDEVITFTDEIRGQVTFRGDTLDDQVLMKSDGYATYHLAHVVDDHFMDIGMVIRGEEWLPSTPKHLILFQMFGWQPPRYAHMPLILNKDRSKLSKRHGDVSVTDFINKGYLPEAIINFLAMLGWNPGTEQELFSLEELIQQFSLERVQKAGAVFDLDKLDWLQGQWIRKIPATEFADRILEDVGAQHPEALSDCKFEEKAALIQERITFFHEAPDMLGYFYRDPPVPRDVVLSAKQKVTEENLPQAMAVLLKTLAAIETCDWSLERIMEDLSKAIDEAGLKKGQVLWPLRAILTGREYSPGAFEVAAVLGKEATMRRLKNFG